jgi:hypothetical protein
LSPTESPSTGVWSKEGGPFQGESNLGVAVAITDYFMAAGGTFGNGELRTYRFVNGKWSNFASILGQEQFGATAAPKSPLFGASVDWDQTTSSFAVGAPGTFAFRTLTPTGAVYFYQLDETGLGWKQLGSTIRGANDRFAADEMFGFSVAVSSGQTIVCGAPYSNQDDRKHRGRVYTFQYSAQTNDWVPMPALPIEASSVYGDNSGDLLGYSVDLADNGSTLIAGGVGYNQGAGIIAVYGWDGTQWRRANVISADGTQGEAFGSSVQVLSADGLYVAAGGPGFRSGRGIIRVYRRSSLDGYDLIGEIVGQATDLLGERGTLAGTDTPNLTIYASTASGAIKRFEYDTESGEFEERTIVADAELKASPALGTTRDGKKLVAGGGAGVNEVNVFAEEQVT